MAISNSNDDELTELERDALTSEDFERLGRLNIEFAKNMTAEEKSSELAGALACLDELPTECRDAVRQRIEVAVDAGWRHIGLWTYDLPATPRDLFGVSPVTGNGEFVP
jgi:hypothetical protein